MPPRRPRPPPSAPPPPSPPIGLDSVKNVAAAGISAGISAAMVAPLDTLRVRWQVATAQPPAPRSPPTYPAPSTIMELGRSIAANEGFVRGLVAPGLSMNVSAIALCSGVRFGLYPGLRDRIAVAVDGDRAAKSAASMTISGFLTGAVAYWLSAPLWNIKTLRQSSPQLASRQTPAPAQAPATATTLPVPATATGRPGTPTLLSVFAEGGMAGLFRGAVPLVIRGACLSGGGMFGYDGSKTVAVRFCLLEDGPALHFTASVISAFCGTCLAAPADVIMTYVQTARQRGVGPAGLLPVIKGLVRDHGLRGLYRGWPVFFARMAPAFALNLTIYEQTRRLLGLPYMD